MLALLTTIFGLLTTGAGIGCAWAAFSRSHAEHGDGPLWPAVHRGGQVVRQVWRRHVLRRRGRVVNLAGSASVGAFAASAWAVVTGPEIDPDLPLEEQVRLLVRRVRNIESQASSDRARFAKNLGDLTAQVGGQAAELRAADEGIRELARSIAVSTVKLQLWGLLLVGVGTVLMALPTLVGLIADVT